jgi:catechol 2,3-dioxygenase-like lactoylglutathione lyase family enzyme
MPPITVTGLDHLVLTVTDPDQTAGFYQRVLGMRPVTFGTGRRALEFGTAKINLHQAGQEITPRAARPLPGSADLCLITTTEPGQVLAHLGDQGVSVEDGPVPRTGARGPITSIYIRDPDRNLIEIASYPRPRQPGRPSACSSSTARRGPRSCSRADPAPAPASGSTPSGWRSCCPSGPWRAGKA